MKRAAKFEGYQESTAFIAKQPWRVDGPRDGTIKFATKLLELPARTYTPKEVDRMATAVRDAEVKAAEARTTGDAWKIHVAEARLRRFQDLLVKWKRPADTPPVKVRVQMLRVGEIAIVAMPGEPFAEIGLGAEEGLAVRGHDVLRVFERRGRRVHAGGRRVRLGRV